MKLIAFTGLSLVLSINILIAQSNHDLLNSCKTGFIENKGQIINQNNNPNPDVLYLLNTPGFNVQLRKGGWSYDVYSISQVKDDQDEEHSIQNPASSIRYHRIDFDLICTNPNCKIITSETSEDYLNYYTPGIPVEGVCFVRYYQKVLFQNIYPDVDLEFIVDDTLGFKYNFIIRPGGSLERIRFHILGADLISESDNRILIQTNQGIIEENIPISIYTAGNIQSSINCRFNRNKRNIFGIESEDKVPDDATLVIDPVPTRLWGTYYGGTEDEGNSFCSVDSAGNVYLSGMTRSPDNIATIGSHQPVIGSNTGDGFLAKFNPQGQRLWGTYYGGTQTDEAYVCVVDKNAFIYLAGKANSGTNIATPGTYQPTKWGYSTDGFLVKFNPEGVRIWGTYYGGDNQDEILSITTDDSGYVYIVGNTQASENIASPGAHQTVYGGWMDGFIAKMDTNGQRVWGSYYGGSSIDNCFSVATNGSDKIFISGMTVSTDNISTPGSFQPTNNGDDAFLAQFNNNGVRMWGTYFGDTGIEYGYEVCLDTNDHIFLAGNTGSENGMATPGVFQTVYGGGTRDGFISRFDTNGSRIWCTYFGGNGSDQILGITVNEAGNIYITGFTGSTDNISTPGAYQETLSGDSDSFVARFDINGQRLWGTYYGGMGNDGAYSIVSNILDSIPTICIAGGTTSLDNIATVGSHQPILGGGIYDCFLAKFEECDYPDPAGQITGNTITCVPSQPLTYTIEPIPFATGYTWIVPSGANIISGQNTDSLTINFGAGAASGYIRVKGVNPCREGDSSSIYVTVNQRPVPPLLGCDSVCEGLPCTYSTDSGKSQYQWSISSGGTIISGGTQVDTSAIVLWHNVGNQWITVNYIDTNGCEAMDPTQFNVEVTPGDTISIGIISSNDSICLGTQITCTANSINTGSNPLFQWFINGVDTNHNDSILTYIPSQTDTVFCVVTSFEPCRSNNPDTSNIEVIHVLPNLPLSVTVTPSENPICDGESVTISASATHGGTNPVYQWFQNNLPVGNNDSTYAFIAQSGDQVSCILTSSDQCTTNNPATSDTITMIVNPLLPVGIDISASVNPTCSGQSVIFTGLPSNGGSSPVYQWQVNGINAGTNNSTFTYIPNDADILTCTLTSNAECITNNPATSNPIIMSVGESPDVSFSVCFDTITTLSAKAYKLKGGIPLGGTYSGPGVDQTTGYFNPAMAGIGIKTIIYSYTNQYTCSNNAIRAISVINPAPLTCGDSLTDIRDNKKYPTIQIGGQCWLAVNLNYGQQIGGSSAQRDNCQVEKYCYNDFSPNCAQYGALYQWNELMCYEDYVEIQGLCPPGWHVPSEADWNQLFAVYQGNAFAARPLLYTGYSGFNVLLAGVEFFNQNHRFADFASIMWSSTSHGPYKAWSHGLNEYNYSVSYYPSYRSNAFSVRCLRD